MKQRADSLEEHEKKRFRLLYKRKMKNLTSTRRYLAELNLYTILSERLKGIGDVLSFSSFGCEIGTKALNQSLASEGRLLLPRIEEDRLVLYRVTNLETCLITSPQGIEEPNPHFCSVAGIENVSVVLVPGLVFDERKSRIGYGGGFYDRLYPLIPKTAILVGTGFIEQLSDEPLPKEEHDLSLHHTFLF